MPKPFISPCGTYFIPAKFKGIITLINEFELQANPDRLFSIGND